MDFLRILFSKTGLLIAVYLLAGVLVNTKGSHFPSTSTADAGPLLHSWVQYIVSIFFWPLSFWQPYITVGPWTGP